MTFLICMVLVFIADYLVLKATSPETTAQTKKLIGTSLIILPILASILIMSTPTQGTVQGYFNLKATQAMSVK